MKLHAGAQCFETLFRKAQRMPLWQSSGEGRGFALASASSCCWTECCSPTLIGLYGCEGWLEEKNKQQSATAGGGSMPGDLSLACLNYISRGESG